MVSLPHRPSRCRGVMAREYRSRPQLTSPVRQSFIPPGAGAPRGKFAWSTLALRNGSFSAFPRSLNGEVIDFVQSSIGTPGRLCLVVGQDDKLSPSLTY